MGHVLGLNQYTHSASACLVDEQGTLCHALAKERLTRKKHDGGDNAQVVRAVLEQAGLGADDLDLVVANNHLFRIGRFERDLEWAVALHQHPSSCLDQSNLLPNIRHLELSHHLAHAWSVLPHAPFERGLIVVADGIGTTRADLLRQSSDSAIGEYHSEVDLPCAEGFCEFPRSFADGSSWREGESVFRFEGMRLERLWKRWIREHSPVFLYNYGFENQESLGALYSRVASHVFGDWNACGKIMGLAPWANQWARDRPPRPLFRGPLEELWVDWERLRSEPDPNRWRDHGDRGAYARLAADLQHDLEQVLLDFLVRLREQSGESNLCLVGGVALNSTANGRIAREAGFEQVYVPPWPGDDGIAVGCAAYGHHLLRPAAAPPRGLPNPYLGGAVRPNDLDQALATHAPWLEATRIADRAARIACAADALAAGETVGWFQGRSEFGPRALGNRSILATPADPDMVERINRAIKKRESFRPFAPTVLAAHADAWFEGVTPSPYMSLTVPVRPQQAERIPAVVHVDGTARIQTLEPGQNPLYEELLHAFHARTGLPMLLNTSFNIRGEPLVESADDALHSFLASDLDLLVIEEQALRKRPFPAPEALADAVPQPQPGWTAEVLSDDQGETVRVHLLGGGESHESDQLELGVLEACDGIASVADLCAAFAEEYELPEAEVIDRLRNLYQRRLLHFGG